MSVSGQQTILVIPNPKEGWDTKKAGNPNPVAHHHLKQDSVDYASKLSIKTKTNYSFVAKMVKSRTVTVMDMTQRKVKGKRQFKNILMSEHSSL
jgi:hypothetical protein